MKALFLDLDGTVRSTKGGFPCPNHPDQQEVMPGRIEKIKSYKNLGYKIIAVTNQGGIGLGIITEQQNLDCLKDLNKKMGGLFDKMYYAKAAPSKGDYMSKPNPGMLFTAKEELGIDLSNSLMVGDRDSDEVAANKAGVEFHWAKDFFEDA